MSYQYQYQYINRQLADGGVYYTLLITRFLDGIPNAEYRLDKFFKVMPESIDEAFLRTQALEEIKRISAQESEANLEQQETVEQQDG